VFIVQYLVSGHLSTMGRYVQQLDINHLDKPLTLVRKFRRRQVYDELDLVVSSFNDMRLTLMESYRDMKIKARMEGELKAAAVIQQSFLPKKPPTLAGYSIASLFLPAREMSGDFFDFIEIDDRHLGLVVADASDKGIPATIHANTARVLLRDKSNLHGDPVALFNELNKSMSNGFPDNRFLTMGYLLLDMATGETVGVNAGHEPFLKISARDNSCDIIKPDGYPFCNLCVDNYDSRIQSARFTVCPGDLLILYSDGLTDIVNETGVMFGQERLCRLIQGHGTLSADEIIENVRHAISSFQGSMDQADDITMIALKRDDYTH
jgi:serine phosphatase RsbU (regulator of sigma subunit)